MPVCLTFVNILMELLQMTTKIYNIDVKNKEIIFLITGGEGCAR